MKLLWIHFKSHGKLDIHILNGWLYFRMIWSMIWLNIAFLVYVLCGVETLLFEYLYFILTKIYWEISECIAVRIHYCSYKLLNCCFHFSHLNRRIRAVFDVAIKVHKNIQQRDIEVGKNLGNWILRWLDRMKPSAQIRAPHAEMPPHGLTQKMNIESQVARSSNQKPPLVQSRKNNESDRHHFTPFNNTWGRPFPTITMMMRQPRPGGFLNQYRHLWISQPGTLRSNYQRERFDGVLRKDIMQWLQNWYVI